MSHAKHVMDLLKANALNVIYLCMKILIFNYKISHRSNVFQNRKRAKIFNMFMSEQLIIELIKINVFHNAKISQSLMVNLKFVNIA